MHAVSAAIYTRQLLSEILYNDPRSMVIPIFCIIDNMQLYDQIESSTQPHDKRIRLDMAELREAVESRQIANFVWVPTQEMLADCLTKKGACNLKLVEVLEACFSKFAAELM